MKIINGFLFLEQSFLDKKEKKPAVIKLNEIRVITAINKECICIDVGDCTLYTNEVNFFEKFEEAIEESQYVVC